MPFPHVIASLLDDVWRIDMLLFVFMSEAQSLNMWSALTCADQAMLGRPLNVVGREKILTTPSINQ